MKGRRLILFGIPLGLALGAAAIGVSIASERKASAPPQSRPKLAAVKRTLDEACSSETTYDRLKTRLFDMALDIGDVDPKKLDLLAGSTVVRMEDPILKAKDEELGVTVCTGRFVVEIPPAAVKAFGGRRQLVADIEYAAQVAADGSGLVYQLRGAEPITYRLAAFDVEGLPHLPPVEAKPMLASADPILMPAELVPAAVVAPLQVQAEPVKAVPAPSAVAQAAEPKKKEATKPKAEPKRVAAKSEAKPKEKAKPVALAKAEKPKAAAKKAEIKTAAKKVKAKAKPEGKLASKAKSQPAAVAKKKPVEVAKAKPKAKAVMLAKAKTKSAPKPAAKPVKQAAAKAPAKVQAKPVKLAAAKPTPRPPVKAAAKTAKPLVKVAKAAPKRTTVQPQRASSSSFACGAGRPFAERLMCANPSLGAKERRMMGVYYSALDNADGRTRRLLQETAGDFQAYRNNCRTEACLSGAFDERVAEIRDIMADMR